MPPPTPNLTLNLYPYRRDLITTIPHLQHFLDRLSTIDLTTNAPILYINSHFTSLGPIRALSFRIPPLHAFCIISISTLDFAAFTTIGTRPLPSGLYLSLKRILESPTIPKVFFGVFETANAFARYHEIDIDGVRDLRIMEMASQDPAYSDVRNKNLHTCIGMHMRLTEEGKQAWRRYQNVNQMVEQGGGEGPSEMVWTVEHDMANVACMSPLWDIYAEKLDRKGPRSWQNVRDVTASHVKMGKEWNADPEVY